MNSYERRLVHNAFKDDPEVATWSPSDSARIKQITLLKRQAKKRSCVSRKRDFLIALGGLAAAASSLGTARRPLRFQRAFPAPAEFVQQWIIFCFHASAMIRRVPAQI